ncbi:MAG: SIS domain-containing protein [Gammaproteobacteria bacterium]|nr:SIS domain-containing protein [Gammaproteobacteria bacterium]NVK87399.1 SIS domain-containing protein [Gammaproteobacteria bacterium]
MSTRIKNAITESIQIKIEAADTLPATIEKAGELMTKSLIEGGKILTCGNGACSVNANYFAQILLNQLVRERPSLPAIALNLSPLAMTKSKESSLLDVYAKQIRAYGNSGDVLLIFTASGQSKNIIKAIETALSRDMVIIAVTANDGGSVAGLMGSGDIEIRVPAMAMPRIIEVQMLVAHALCDYIENSLFGEV